MTDTLNACVRAEPVLAFWACTLAAGYLLGLALAAFQVNDASRELVADVRLAMKRADLSVDFVARCTGVPAPKLSDQLNGKTPFTSFWRFIAPEIKASRFWDELFALRAERHGGVYVRGDLAVLVRGVERLVLEKEKAS